jgi:Cys-tRNA(Pro) deacylase
MARIRTHATRILDDEGVPYEVLEQAHRAMNVEQAAAERGVAIRQIVKTLLILGPDRKHIVVLVRGDRRLSLKKLARVEGVKQLKMAPASDVPRITGYQVGAVAPLGLRRRDVPTYIDQSILEEPRVSISAGRHDAGLELDTDDLIKVVGGRVEDVTE